MRTAGRLALISLLTATAGCGPILVIFAPENSGTSGEWIEGTGANDLTNGEPDGSNSGTPTSTTTNAGIDAPNATSDRILLRVTTPDGLTITAGSPSDPDQDWIELVSVYQGVSGPPVSSFYLTKYVDTSSVKLYDYVQNGVRLPKVEIMITRAHSNPMMTFVLEGALFASMQFESHPDDMPTEELVLTWEKLSCTYYKYDTQGQLVGPYTYTRNRLSDAPR
jgi:type VI protein secretion system component Hcp